jgi:HD-GYP domain-containing protein (c-di-GMP phosphodiesterase class II)
VSLDRAISSSFFRRLAFLVLAAGGLPVFLVACFFVNTASHALTREWINAQKHFARVAGQVLDNHVRSCLSRLRTLEKAALVTNRKFKPETEEILRNWANQDGPVWLSLLGSEGVRIDSGPLISNDPALSQIALADTGTSNTAVVTAPVFSTVFNEFVFAAGIPTGEGTNRRTLVGLFRLQPALNRMRELGGPSFRAVLAGPGFRLNLLGDVSGDTATTSGVPIRETGWQLIPTISESESHAEALEAVRRIFKWSLLALILALALSSGLAFNLARPLWQLEESARRITAGFHTAQTPAQDRTEIGAVARSFQEMAAQVRQHLNDLNAAIEDSKQLFTGIIRALASAIDAKDPYTSGHSERVTRFAMEIGRLMELPEPEVDRIKLGALIHDVGKISVDDRILKKPCALTDDEFRIMKTHTTRGYDMMKHIPQLNDILPGLQSHHEQIDGNGYPEGLKGEEIPMIARVIMVADCFDAMTAKRPYQNPAPIDQVLHTIRSLAGTRYDEHVVNALVRGVETGRILPDTPA